MTRKRSKSKAKDSEEIGFFANRFSKHLEDGLHVFGRCFQEFYPHHIKHEENGTGVLFSQLAVASFREDLCQKHAVIAFEDGIHFHTGFVISFTNEQTPEKVALLFLAALVNEQPVAPDCESCQEEENDE